MVKKKIVKKVENTVGGKKQKLKKSGGKNETGAINKNGCLKKSIKIVDKKYWRKKISSQNLKKSGVKKVMYFRFSDISLLHISTKNNIRQNIYKKCHTHFGSEVHFLILHQTIKQI